MLLDDLEKQKASFLIAGRKSLAASQLRHAWEFDEEVFEALIRDYRDAAKECFEALGTWECFKYVDRQVNEIEILSALKVSTELSDLLEGECGTGLFFEDKFESVVTMRDRERDRAFDKDRASRD